MPRLFPPMLWERWDVLSNILFTMGRRAPRRPSFPPDSNPWKVLIVSPGAADPDQLPYCVPVKSGSQLRRLAKIRTVTMMLESIKGSLKEKGVRLTRQRQILLELIDRSGQHLNAEQLFQLAKEQDPKLNRV